MNRREFLKAGTAIVLGAVTGLIKVNAKEPHSEKVSTGWDVGWNVEGWDIGSSVSIRPTLDNKIYVPLVSS